MIKTRVVEVPWMTRCEPHGQPVDVVVETPEGKKLHIQGLTHDSTLIPPGQPMLVTGCWTRGWLR